MNVAYPNADFLTEEAAIEGFIDLIVGGYENPEGITGTVGIIVPELPEKSFVATFGDELEISEMKVSTVTDTQVTIPMETIQRIFREFETIDWRDPAIIGTVSLSGNLGLANHLAKSCVRPSDWTQARFRKVGKLHAANNYSQIEQVMYLHQPSQMQVLEAMSESQPVVITGLEPSPPCSDWTLDRLAKNFGNAVVRVRSAEHRQTMAEFVDELKAFEAQTHTDFSEGFGKPYTEGAALPKEMWEDFGPLFFNREDFIDPQLWLGSVPTHIPASSLHRDPLTGFLYQVMGRKRLDLYSADQADLIYPMKAYNNYQPCWFKAESPDFEIYPKAQKAKCLSVVLHPGELLVQPAGWFHQVYALDSPTMSVSYFWRY